MELEKADLKVAFKLFQILLSKTLRIAHPTFPGSVALQVQTRADGAFVLGMKGNTVKPALGGWGLS